MSKDALQGESVVVELRKRGRLVVGEPYFVPGVPMTLDRRTLGDAEPGDLVLARTGRGRARVEHVVGAANRVENVLAALLLERGERGAQEPHAAPPIDGESRADLRDLPTVTIDPETAKDFDDAISIQRDGGALRAFVHIADVSYFVPAGTPLDLGAAERGFSVYVPGLVAPMLPHSLADDLCSLRPHQDRLTITVEVPWVPGIGPGSPSFYRSLIRSDARLTYGEAEAILVGKGGAQPAVAETIALAETLASELRGRRFARGALRVESRETAFAFDGSGGVERAWLDAEPHAHMLVEELMILANEAVAGLLAGRSRETLYRVHEPPDPQSVTRLLAMLADLGVPTPPAPGPDGLSPAGAAELAAAISVRVTEYATQSGRGMVAFPPLVLRALKQARYAAANLGHSGLASRAYCHFTSPIRRYPDLVCHRALVREIGAGDDPPPADVPGLGEHVSEREREIASIEYAADEICLAWLLQRVLFERGWSTSFEGEITGVIASGLFVRFDDVFEGYVPARRLSGDYFEVNPLGTGLAGRRSGRTYRLGDRLDVRVERIERASGKVELAPAPAVGRRRREA